MKLLTINPDSQEIELNKEWIFLIPEFTVLFKRDKGSPSDYRGDKKLRTRKELTFIYFMEDFSSSLRDWDATKKRQEALRYAMLEEKDIDKEVKQAQDFYHNFVRECSRSLRTLDSLHQGMDALDKYFREVDFNTTDKMGRAKYTPAEYQKLVTGLSKMNSAIKEYEKQVEEELRENTGIRGKNTLGTMEGQRKSGWDEGGPPITEKFTPTRKIIDYE